MNMKSAENCGVCGQPLVYGTEEVLKKCAFCGQEQPALIYCPEGHYICDDCHRKESLDILKEVLKATKSTDPIEILEKVMAHPSVTLHGPEHHVMVPAIIVAAAGNAGYPLPENAIEKAMDRGAKVPGGWCGSHGVCGAAIGVGTAVSVFTGATPLKGEQRGLANQATAFALGRMLDGGPRCCKRASRTALGAAVEFLRDRLGINLTKGKQSKCVYSGRNKECLKEACAYYGASSV